MGDLPNRELSTKLASGEVTTIKLGGTGAGDTILNQDSMDARYQDLLGVNAIPKTKYTPQATAPAHAEGQIYYDDVHKDIAMQTDVSGYPVHFGTDTIIRVINKTGIAIAAGKAIRNGGIDATSNQIKAVMAKADLLTTSFVIGFTATEIAVEAEGWVVNQGHVHDLDTSLLVAGGTLFLSATAAGEVTQTPPDITSALGTVMISDALDGVFFTKIDNLITYPKASGVLRGQNTPLYSVTTTSQNLVDYAQSVDIILTVSEANGTFTVPLNGHYIVTFSAIPEFASAPSTRTLYFELYNETLATALGAYPRNIPKDAVGEGISFSSPIIDAVAGHVYRMRIKASESISVTLNSIAFTLSSSHLG